MNTFSVLLIAAILVMASSAPNNNKEKVMKFADNKGDRWQWQSIGEIKYNFANEYLDIIIDEIFDLFPYQIDDLLRMQELVRVLDNNADLATMCPPGNNWSMFGFKLCGKDHVLGNPDGHYFVFHYSNDEDEEGARYVLYNDCK